MTIYQTVIEYVINGIEFNITCYVGSHYGIAKERGFEKIKDSFHKQENVELCVKIWDNGYIIDSDTIYYN